MSSQAILFTGVDPMTGVVDIGSMIERSPRIRGGRPCIAGTGVSVRRIAQWHNFGLTPEEIAAGCDLPLEAVREAKSLE